MSVLSQSHSIIFDRGISAPGYGKEVVDGLNSIDKRYMYQLISTVQLTASKTFENNIIMHSFTPRKDASLGKESQKICLRMIVNRGLLIRGKTGKETVK